MKHIMPSMLKAVTMAVGIRNYHVSGSLSRSNCLYLKMKLKSKLHTKSFFKGFPMGAYNTDGGDTVERNYNVSSSILDLVVNYLEEFTT